MAAIGAAPVERRLGYPLVDADNHYYEPYDCFTRHLEARYRDRAIHVVPGKDGLGRLYLGERRLAYMRVIQTDYIGKPGSLRAFFEGNDAGGFTQRDLINAREDPAFMEREARLARMDAQGIEAMIQLPSLGCAVEPEMHDDPELTLAHLRAFNRWLEEDWGYAYQNRIFAVPLLSLLDVDRAVAELERVLASDARAVQLKAGPVGGRSPGDPVFDPFWARVEEAAIPVIFHVGHSGYAALFSGLWSERPDPPLQDFSAFQYLTCNMERPIFDTLGALVLHNVFGRFPGLRVMSIENGSAWVEPLLKGIDKAARMGAHGRWLGGALAERPSDIFRRHVYVAPFYEEDVLALVERLGPNRVLFGSDYPHPEGLAEPAEFADLVAPLPPDQVRRILRENTASLLGLASAPAV